jgi:hypothetical protein
MNYVFLAVGSKVLKFDLVTKERLFEFTASAKKNMMLYDYDDKLIVSDSKN